MTPVHVSFVVACSALVAGIVAPMVSLRVSRRQFSASVLSANRERWITSLREAIAELVSLIATLSMHKSLWRGEWPAPSALAADGELVKTYQRLVLLNWNIRLLVNPDEMEHQALCRCIDDVIQRLRDGAADSSIGERDIDSIVKAAQPVLRAAWRRAKLGT